MRKLIGCVVGLFLIPAAVQAESLTVATFNAEFLTRPTVHMKFGEKLKLSGTAKATWSAPGYRDQKFREGVEQVASVIKQIDADILILIEVGNHDDVSELNDALAAAGGSAYPHIAVCDCTDRYTAQHVAILSRHPLSDVMPRIEGREGYLTEADDPDTEKDTGLSKGMRATATVEGTKIHIYAVHLASERGGHEQDQQRIAQASIVRRHMLPLLQAGEHVIVAGDLNDRRGQPAIHRIRGLHDMWPDLVQTGQVKFFKKAELGSRWTYTFQGERNQIDHVLVSRDLAKRAKARVLDHGNDGASDHRPLIVTLKVR